MSSLEARKGASIIIHSGKYAREAYEGWLDKSQNWSDEEGCERAAVIVRLKKGKGLRATVIYKCNYEIASTSQPATYAAAILAQRPALKTNIVTVSRQLAQCDRAQQYKTDIEKMLTTEFQNALTLQQSRGAKATYRKINFGSDSDVLMMIEEVEEEARAEIARGNSLLQGLVDNNTNRKRSANADARNDGKIWKRNEEDLEN